MRYSKSLTPPFSHLLVSLVLASHNEIFEVLEFQSFRYHPPGLSQSLNISELVKTCVVCIGAGQALTTGTALEQNEITTREGETQGRRTRENTHTRNITQQGEHGANWVRFSVIAGENA